ncbi:hypothetical protein BB559_000256 [Furculomyces boomerangus]|uniref:2-dehydropantoate 2-reductase n=1 Tax=Furculomyces boomerangus TaxID=61424 RepID=A0A2T9Z5R1_9FUNG|nr:hypothetical protein BB559_000256 [Furculomyces boomerangus]
MHTLIVGAGSVGSMCGWRIKEGGENVSVVCRSNYEAVKENGFSIESARYGSRKFIPNNVYSTCEDASKDQEYDYILVCTKALPNIADPTDILKPLIKSSKTVIVLLQNGIGLEDPYVKAYPKNLLITCVVYIESEQKQGGIIKHGKMMELAYGLHKNKKDDNLDLIKNNAISNFHNILTSGGITSTVSTNIQKLKWFKNVWNATISPMSVISGKYSGEELVRNPGTRQLILNAMGEIIKVGEAVTGGPLHDKLSASEISEYFVISTESLLKTFIPSMLQDFINKKPMEHQVILKNVIESAKRFNINVPILETTYELLVMNEKKYLKPKGILLKSP